MKALRVRLSYLFQSTKGLVLTAVGLVSLVTAIWGLLSGPAVEWGIRDVVVRTLGMRLVEAEREGRLIMLYHSLAIPAVAILVYLITDVVPMKERQRTAINATVTAGYPVVMFGGLGFAYFGHSWVLHGLFILGESLVFFAGCQLAVALWPANKDYRVTDPAYAHTRGGIDLERAAFFTMALATLGSAIFGAVAGASYGNGFQTFLAENVIREPHHTVLEYAVVGHLHIMVALVAIATTLVIGRWLDFKGIWHKLAMPLMILGTVLLTLGVWGVVTPLEPIAHMIIYVGATPSMLAALFLIFYAFPKFVREHLAETGRGADAAAGLRAGRPGLGRKLAALVHDPLKFCSLWQMIFMNFTVSGVGIFMAVRLDEIFRVWPSREERIELTGHWHILSVLTASIILFYVADQLGLRGKVRRWFAWLVTLGSDLAFAAVTVFEMKRLFVSEYDQQPVVDLTMALTDVGLILFLVVLAAFLVWRLVDLFRANGRWRSELAGAGLAAESEFGPAVPVAGRTGLDTGTRSPAGRPARHDAGHVRAGLVPVVALAALLAVAAVNLASCAPASGEVAWPPAFDTGVEPGSWALVPAGDYFAGQFDEPASLDYDFEISLTDVTNADYARFLGEALAAGKVKVVPGSAVGRGTAGEPAGDAPVVVGYYPGDAFHGGRHEKEIGAGDWLYFDLGSPASRITFDGRDFSAVAGYEDHPVTMVTWFGAWAYADFYGWRLPTEAEWEKAARGSDTRPYPWGSGIDDGYANYYHSRDPFERPGIIGDTTPVGFYNGRNYGGFQTADARSPYGLYDMAGNVAQWTADVYAGTHQRYLRGGSKADYGYDLRLWTRRCAPPDYASPNVGFRCARDPGK